MKIMGIQAEKFRTWGKAAGAGPWRVESDCSSLLDTFTRHRNVSSEKSWSYGVQCAGQSGDGYGAEWGKPCQRRKADAPLSRGFLFVILVEGRLSPIFQSANHQLGWPAGLGRERESLYRWPSTTAYIDPGQMNSWNSGPWIWTPLITE